MTRDHQELLERVKAQVPPPADALERLRERRDAKTRRSRMAAGIVGLAATAGIVALLVTWASTTGGDGSLVGPASESPAVPLVAEPGQYYYVRFAWYDFTDQGAGTRVGQIWFGPDDSGRRVVDSPLVSESRDERFGPGEFPAEFLPDLSTDPSVVLTQLIERGSPEGASPNPIPTSSPGRTQETTSLLRTLEDLLSLGSDAFLTPEQTAAVFEAAQTIGDVTVTPDVTDPLGRSAVRLSFVIDYNQGTGSTVEWYFDPTTDQFMGEVWVDAQSGATSATMIEAAGIAPSMNDRPPADALYVPQGAAQATFPGDRGGH
jgi:hypothetical protein